jgi:chlorobactene glucosyltransferase
MVSICIPARNEAISINSCVRSALLQTYSNIEIIVLDDESTDETPLILQEIKDNVDDSIQILKGTLKPVGWLGKNWACYQLSRVAKGDILLFIDADVSLEPHTVEALVMQFEQHQETGLISVWPQQEMITFWEHVLVPMVYYTLFGFLFLRYTQFAPRWIPSPMRSKFAPLFSAACGQFMAFQRLSYEAINGHESVKSEVVEDVQLAKKVIESGKNVINLSGKDAVYCRMYRSYDEIKNGFRKNFFAGFGYNYLLFIASAFMHLVVFVLPYFLIVFYSLHQFWYGALLSYVLIIIPIFQRFWLHRHFNWKQRFVATHVLGVLWFQYLGILAIKDRFLKRTVSWKGRPV